jgi:hypothetical protein
MTVRAPLPEGMTYNVSVIVTGAKVEIKQVEGDRVTLANVGTRATPFALTAISEEAATALAGVGNIIGAIKKSKETPRT